MTQITLHAKRIWTGLLSMSIILILLHIGSHYLYQANVFTYERMRTFFNLNAEANLPTTFTVLVFGVASLLLAAIAIKSRLEKGPFTPQWTFLAAVFLFVSIDEGSMLHEIIIRPITNLYSNNPFGIFTFSWVAILLVLLIVFALVFYRFFLHLPSVSKRLFIISGLLYLSGAILFEGLGGMVIRAFTSKSVQFFWINTVEESLELIGMCFLVYALLIHLFGDGAEIKLKAEK